MEPESFSVIRRNYGHWDITTNKGRIFAIRGGPGKYFIRDERDTEIIEYGTNKTFNTVSACMNYICDLLMFELIVVEGQNPTVIESWNI